MFPKMTGGDHPKPGGQFKTWQRYKVQFTTWQRFKVEDFGEFRATEGSAELAPMVFDVWSALWSSAYKKARKWCWGILEAVERFMVRLHESEVD